jgi:hypothetical protein
MAMAAKCKKERRNGDLETRGCPQGTYIIVFTKRKKSAEAGTSLTPAQVKSS